MQDFFNNLSELLGNLSSNIFSLVPLVGVILLISIINRVLTRQAQRTTGKRFRNQLIVAVVTFVGVLVIVIVLPLDAGVRGQLLTLIGIIISVTISLSSSTFLGNAMAGVMLKTVRNFRSGDFIQVGDHFGRVTERSLFHTEIQTASRDLTTLPNLYLATTPVKVVRSSGTIVDATISLGFDIPHGKVESLLMDAVAQAELEDAFVQVLDLGNYSVTYRAAGLLEDTKRLLTFRSRLRVAMLDCLHKGGVEIVSPNFMNVRDYDPHHKFVPKASQAPEPVATDAPVEVVFDKAEDAETLSGLRKELADLTTSNKDLADQIKEAPDKEAKQKLEAKLARSEVQVAKLEEDIAAAESREKADDD